MLYFRILQSVAFLYCTHMSILAAHICYSISLIKTAYTIIQTFGPLVGITNNQTILAISTKQTREVDLNVKEHIHNETEYKLKRCSKKNCR